MIKRYLSTETNLDHNKYVLHPMKAVVTEEANGIFELEIELPKGTQLNKRDLITAPTPRGTQPFRVYRIVKTLYGIRAYARHIFYDLANALLIDTRPTNANVNSALQSIFTAVGWSGWSYLSDITEQKTAYYIRKNPIEAIIGAENSILNVWGGNLVRDNKEVRIYADGLDRGYEIRLGKNLIGIEDDSDDSNVVTRLYPTYEKDQVIYGIPEQYVDSPLIGNYPTPITKEIRVALTDDQKGYTDEQIYQVLRDYCNNLYSVDNVDKPVVNYKVDFVELSKIARLEQEVSYNYAGLEQLTYETIETLTYDQLESVATVQQFIDLLEQIDLYDKVKIRVKELDIDLQARVIKYQYDALAERYIKIELGGFKNSNQYQINNIVQQMKNDREKASTEYRELYDLAINQVTGNKGGYQITRLNANNEPYETLWMDTPDIETAVNVLRINQSGIAGSNSGFNGPYNVAITTDGWVVAERILANQLSAISANLGEVTTGKLLSQSGNLQVDLDNDIFRVTTSSGLKAILDKDGMAFENADSSQRTVIDNGYLSLRDEFTGRRLNLSADSPVADSKIYSGYYQITKITPTQTYDILTPVYNSEDIEINPKYHELTITKEVSVPLIPASNTIQLTLEELGIEQTELLDGANVYEMSAEFPTNWELDARVVGFVQKNEAGWPITGVDLRVRNIKSNTSMPAGNYVVTIKIGYRG